MNNDYLNAEQKQRLQEGLRILGRIIARAHLRSRGYSVDDLGGDSDVKPAHEPGNDITRSKKSNRTRTGEQGNRRGGKDGHRFDKGKR